MCIYLTIRASNFLDRPVTFQIYWSPGSVDTKVYRAPNFESQVFTLNISGVPGRCINHTLTAPPVLYVFV